MIFVVLAMRILVSGFFSYRICPVSASIKTADVAETDNAKAWEGARINRAQSIVTIFFMESPLNMDDSILFNQNVSFSAFRFSMK